MPGPGYTFAAKRNNMAYQLIVPIITIVIALIVLIISAEKAVRKVLGLANHFKLSATFAGLTVFAIATSLPELIAHITASVEILRGNFDYKIASATVLGANIGSDVIQQTFILGLVVLLMGGLVFKRKFLMTAYLPMIGTTLLCILLGWDGVYSRLDGLILITTFFVYLVFIYRQENNNHYKHKGKHHVGRDGLIAFGCIILMMISAHILLKQTQILVQLTGLGGSLIGVVTLGVAAATPELFTAIEGLKQKQPGMSLGTLIGSNITNPLLAIGTGALISTHWVPRALIQWDLAMETVTATLLLVYLLYNKGKLGKVGAYYLIGLYFFYLIIRITFFAVD